MRVITWNLGQNSSEFGARHAEAWDYLMGELKPDVALVQEAVPPAGLDGSVAFARPWARRKWGSAVVSASGHIRKSFTDTAGGPVVVAELDDGLIAVSIHARIVQNRTIPTLRKTFKRLLPRMKDRRLVVGGDLNTARGADAIWPKNGHREFFASLTGMGLYDCHWELNHERETPSFWGRTSPHALQLDHLFVDAKTGNSGKVASCEVLNNAEVRALSDHGPVVAEIAP